MRVQTAQTRRTAALTPTGSTPVRDLSRRISHGDFQIVASRQKAWCGDRSRVALLRMRWVVFLRAVNVGGTNRCQPALIAKQLARFDIVNIGAVGTFVVGENVSESALRVAFARKLPFKCEIMICPARDIIKLAAKDPFSGQPSGPDIVRFVSVLAKRLRALPPLPLSLPSDDDWLLKIITIQDRFVLGQYRRQMKAISYLGKIEKRLGVAVTTRNWNTIEKVARILESKL
jgi:uncharacterized protein (DUF1697 family)